MIERTKDPNEKISRQGCHPDWPQAVLELAGSLPEFLQQEELRAEQGDDSLHEATEVGSRYK